ncbi:MSMEG_0565 family glycosyltransferase [Marisediminicola senii]|uniref:MSMEG_0565 family glycosyltransferase n=1 Tax=Marisediminicola senii TaxID=2711233 RepID=UPI0013ED9301|nr:MSMEG_0565 family glycosyltransferase [Marisediminicola senii]
MRIALLTYSTKPRGGVVHTLALAEALAAAGADVTVVTLGRGGDTAFFRPVDPSVRVLVVPFAHRDGEGVGERIRRSIRTLRAGFDPAGYDIVHAEDCISANAVDGAIRTVHHLDQFTTPELVECHERAIVEPRALVTVSASVAAEVASGWGRDATVIPNGVDSAAFERAAGPAGSGDRARWRDELGEYVLAVGGIEPRKGTIELLEAFGRVRSRHPALSLVIAGGETLFDYSDYRNAFDTRAAELGIAVRVLGTVDQERMPSLVAAASIMAFVSTKEGFGLAAMEALAAGTPVVARDLPVLREVFGDAVGYATDPASIADRIESGLAGRAPERGRQLARSYTWAAAAAAHLALYRTLSS